jgi:cytosine/uracil/thiamine/allantoin permease
MNLIWDDQEKAIRGCFVNLLITFSILFLIVYGILFDASVVERIKTLETLIVGFFTASFGIWSIKKAIEKKSE